MDFKAKFNKAVVLDFLKNQFLPDDFSESREAVKFSQLSFAPERIKEVEFIGESPSLALKLYIVRHESENDPRVTLSRETFRVMSNLGAQRALVVYHSTSSPNYRLSLTTITLALKGTKTKREYSNPRRYSFFLGPDAKTHTPEQFLLEKVSDFEDLLGRFSIEVVNKDFYNEIATKFTALVGGKRKVKTKVVDFDKPVLRLPGLDMSKPGSHITAQEFAVRLIGRIVFCWFLKKKKSPGGEALLPESVLSSAAVTACDKAGDNYYHTVLENFFFQVLNTEMAERGEEFKKAPYGKIPFLNGGLFEPHDGDFYDFDALTVCSRHASTLKIHNEWFRGLLETLEAYNFTIDENTSVDVELAVDPEMLGRIFENLLAEINPETGETARKSTGSYYTPRPIVEYMVDESLKEYLKTKTSIAKNKLADLLSYAESDIDFSEPEKEKIVSALDEVKIIDPACGSGAFPMGMLQKIVLVLQKVDPDSQKWLSKLLDSVPDATARETLRKKLEGEADLWNYTRKLGVIRKSIYGVDIQPIAVEISKLRFFLSLVVDEKVDDKKENRAIEPLPNLEFKFVCANTLIGLPATETIGKDNSPLEKLKLEQAELGREFIQQHNTGQLNLLAKNQIEDRMRVLKKEIARIEKELESTGVHGEIYDNAADIDHLKRLRDSYFTASSIKKLKIENEFLTTQKKMIMHSQGWGKPDTKAMKLSQWEPFKNKSTAWFDPGWMFGLEDGFDIVIANPPYVRQEDIKQFKTAFKAQYSCFTGTADLYVYFYERGFQLLRSDGILTFISSNKYFRSGYGEKLRGFLTTQGEIRQLIDFGDAPVFTAIAYPSIIVVSKVAHAAEHKAPHKEHQVRVLSWNPADNVEEFVSRFNAGSFLMPQTELKPDCWRLEAAEVLNLLSKLRNAGKPLGEYVNGRFYYGIKTGLNEAFVVDHATRDRLITEHKSSTDVLKPFLRGRDVKRWRTEFAGKYLIKIESSENKKHPWSDKSEEEAEKVFSKTYPAIHAHFKALEKIKLEKPDSHGSTNMLEQLLNRDDQGKYFWELRSCIYWSEFEKSKIVIPAITDNVNYAADTKGYFSNDKTSICITDNPNSILALLNSRVLWWFMRQVSASKQGGFYEFKPMYVSQLPIAEAHNTTPLKSLVDKILVTKRTSPVADVSALEHEIDQHVYKLYNLTPSEIAIIEGKV